MNIGMYKCEKACVFTKYQMQKGTQVTSSMNFNRLGH